jgi:hypothetical protein
VIRRLLVVVLALTVLGASCGLPEDGEPRPIAAEDLPDQLGGREGTTPPSSAVTGESREVYLIETEASTGDKRLAGLPVVLGFEPTPKSMMDQLLEYREETLAEFPTLSNAIPPDTRVLSFEQDDDIGIITLSEEFEPEGENYQLAVAQLVFTATELGTVQRIRFRVGEDFIQVPAGEDGAFVDIVTREDYRDLQPELTTETS